MERKVLYLVSVLVVSAGNLALAQAPIHPGSWDASWRGLTFGANREEVLKVLEQRIRDRYAALLRRTLDIRERDRLTREMQREIEEVQASRVVFPEGESTWSVSILKEDYEPGQEMILVREGPARYYMLFHEGALYKWIALPEDPSRDAAMASLQQVFGSPAEVQRHWDDTVIFARWKDAGPLCASLQDYTREFQTVLVRFAQKDLEERFRTARSQRKAPALNPLIEAAKAPPEATDANGDQAEKPGRKKSPPGKKKGP